MAGISLTISSNADAAILLNFIQLLRFTIPELRTALTAVLHVLCPAMRIGFESAAAIPLCA